MWRAKSSMASGPNDSMGKARSTRDGRRGDHLPAHEADRPRKGHWSRHRRGGVALASDVAQSRDALDLARARYSGGVANFVDVLDAERSLQQNELALASNTTAISTDLVAIYRAPGGGWET